MLVGKIEIRGIKISLGNLIRITKSINLLYFFMVLVVRCDIDIFKLTARAQSINSESLCTVLCESTFCSILKIKEFSLRLVISIIILRIVSI